MSLHETHPLHTPAGFYCSAGFSVRVLKTKTKACEKPQTPVSQTVRDPLPFWSALFETISQSQITEYQLIMIGCRSEHPLNTSWQEKHWVCRHHFHQVGVSPRDLSSYSCMTLQTNWAGAWQQPLLVRFHQLCVLPPRCRRDGGSERWTYVPVCYWMWWGQRLIKQVIISANQQEWLSL